MSHKPYFKRKLRTQSCVDETGKCKETDKGIEHIENVFNKPEKKVLDVMNSYLHSLDSKDPSGQLLPHDCSGYSALHLAAERNMIPVAEKLLESGFDPLTIGCRDKTGKLALHVAIEKGFDKMAALIITHMEPADVRDLFCNQPENPEFKECKNGSKTKDEALNVFSVNYLIQKDCVFVKTIQAVFESLKDVHDDGRCTVYVKLLDEDNNGLEPRDEFFNANHHTVFHNLNNAQKEVANHPVIGMLIDHKWKAFGRRKFVSVFLLYLMTLISLTFAIASGVIADDVRKYDTSLQRARGFFEVVVCFGALHRFVKEVLEMKRHKLDYCKEFFNWIELLSTVCIFIVVLLRYTTENAHWFVLAVAYVLWILRIFKYATVSSRTGVYAESLRQILTDNFVQFSLLFVVVNLAFGGVFLLVLKGEGRLNTHHETSTIYGVWLVGLRTLIEASPIVEYTGSDGYGTASTIVMLLFETTTIVILLNILIAQLSSTYSKIQDDAVKYNRANVVAILTRIERNELNLLSFVLEHLSRYLFNILSLCGCNERCMDKLEESAKSDREKYYKPVFEEVDLQRKSFSTLIEDIHEQIHESNRAQIRTDLKAQTIKTRLRQLDKKIDEKFQALTDLLSKKNKHDSDSDAETTNGSVSSRSENEMSDHSSTERGFENMSNSDTKELSGDEINNHNRKVRKGTNPYKKDAPSLETVSTCL